MFLGEKKDTYVSTRQKTKLNYHKSLNIFFLQPKADFEECPPCTVKGPLPKQTGCKEIHPCDEQHPCMCDPNTGEPIDAERCGPFDTKYHEFYPPQVELISF